LMYVLLSYGVDWWLWVFLRSEVFFHAGRFSGLRVTPNEKEISHG
jgi:hypothetical protein